MKQVWTVQYRFLIDGWKSTWDSLYMEIKVRSSCDHIVHRNLVVAVDLVYHCNPTHIFFLRMSYMIWGGCFYLELGLLGVIVNVISFGLKTSGGQFDSSLKTFWTFMGCYNTLRYYIFVVSLCGLITFRFLWFSFYSCLN